MEGRRWAIGLPEFLDEASRGKDRFPAASRDLAAEGGAECKVLRRAL